MNYPSIIDRTTLEPLARLSPSSLSVTLKIEPTSTAQMVLAKGQPSVVVGDWLRVYTTQGDAGVFVVKQVTTNEITGEKQVSAEHAICLLKRSCIFGKYNENKASINVKSAIKDVLKHQAEQYWTLDKCEYTDVQPYSFDNDNLLDAIEDIRDSLDDSQLELSTNALPFKLSVVKRPTVATCEMRVAHNVGSLSINVDTSEMFTRIYPRGADDIHISGDYIEKNAKIYGVISAIKNNDEISDQTDLKNWAKNQLKRNCEPTVVATINGLQLSDVTGEQWDKLVPGSVCQVPLSQYGGANVVERIDSINFKDLVTTPEQVTVTLSNARKDVRLMKSASAKTSENTRQISRSGGRAKSNLEVVKKYIRQVDDGFELRVTKMFDTGGQFASIKLTSDSITSAVKKLKKGSAGELLADMETQIKQTAESVKLSVKKGDVINQINLDSSGATISANRINLQGYVTASSLKAGFTVSGTLTTRVLEVPPNGFIRLYGMNFTTRRMLAADGKSVYTALVAENGGR